LLYRVFPWNPESAAASPGGALHVPRSRQGTGRHDNPDRYGALYMSRSAESAVAERIASFRGQQLVDDDFVVAAGRYALAAVDDSNLGNLVDLDDPTELVARSLRPSRVATLERSITQTMAAALFDEGIAGFGWWSTLNADWANVTLFAERAVAELTLASEPEPLSIAHPAVVAVAPMVGVNRARRPRLRVVKPSDA
jgi:RES domain-containing protein